MVSSNYGYNANSYYGYNAQQPSNTGSMLGASNPDPAGIGGITSGISETYKNALNPQQTKSSSGGIGGFFKGLANGAKNMVSSLMSPKGLLMAAGAAALTFVFPPAGFALLAVGGVAAGTQVAKGVASGNMEQVGEGVFGLGMTALGARGMGGALKGKDGATYTAAKGQAVKAASNADDAARVASQADDAVAAAKAAGKSSDEIANLQNAAKTANQKADDLLALQVKAESRVEYGTLTKVDQKALASGSKPTAKDLSSAKSNLSSAQAQLRSAKFDAAGPNASQAAKNNLAQAEAAVDNARKSLHQIELTLQSQRGQVGKTLDSVKDAFSIIKGDKLVGPDGKTITLYNRGKAPDKVAASAAGSADDAAVASKSTTANTANVADDAAAVAATPEKSTGWLQSAKNKANGLLTPTKDANGNVITTGTSGYLNHIRQNPGTTILNGHFLNQGLGQVIG